MFILDFLILGLLVMILMAILFPSLMRGLFVVLAVLIIGAMISDHYKPRSATDAVFHEPADQRRGDEILNPGRFR